MKKNQNNQFPLHQEMEEDGEWGHGSVHSSSFLLLLPLQIFPCCSVGHPWARVLQDKLLLSQGPPQAAGISIIQHLELILLTFVSAGLFLTLFSPIYFLLPVPFLKPVSLKMPPLSCGAQPCPVEGWLELSARAAPHGHCPGALQDQSLAT